MTLDCIIAQIKFHKTYDHFALRTSLLCDMVYIVILYVFMNNKAP